MWNVDILAWGNLIAHSSVDDKVWTPLHMEACVINLSWKTKFNGHHNCGG